MTIRFFRPFRRRRVSARGRRQRGIPTGKSFCPFRSNSSAKGVEYRLPLPGAHNLENLRAALCVCEYLGCEGSDLACAVSRFEGVARRFTIIKTSRGIYVVDDFAHNPAKIAAAVSAVRGLSERIIAVIPGPHGFGPTRFLKDEYIETFRSVFKDDDAIYLLPIYYAGGTAQKDISSEDIIEGLGTNSFGAHAVKDREDLLVRLGNTVRPGDCILVMGGQRPIVACLGQKDRRFPGWGDEKEIDRTGLSGFQTGKGGFHEKNIILSYLLQCSDPLRLSLHCRGIKDGQA